MSTRRELAVAGRIEAAFGTRDGQRRWSIALRGLLVVPHVVVALLREVLVLVLFVLGWVVALLSGRVSTGVIAYQQNFLRYVLRVSAYFFLLTDQYPPFSLERGRYQIDAEFHGVDAGRIAVLFRLVLALPAAAAAGAANLGLFVSSPIVWVVVLASGRVPEDLFAAESAVLRFQVRCSAYMLLVSDAYPDRLFGDSLRIRRVEANSEAIADKTAAVVGSRIVLFGPGRADETAPEVPVHVELPVDPLPRDSRAPLAPLVGLTDLWSPAEEPSAGDTTPAARPQTVQTDGGSAATAGRERGGPRYAFSPQMPASTVLVPRLPASIDGHIVSRPIRASIESRLELSVRGRAIVALFLLAGLVAIFGGYIGGVAQAKSSAAPSSISGDDAMLALSISAIDTQANRCASAELLCAKSADKHLAAAYDQFAAELSVVNVPRSLRAQFDVLASDAHSTAAILNRLSVASAASYPRLSARAAKVTANFEAKDHAVAAVAGA